MKALLRTHLRREGHVQVTCLLENQKVAPRRSLHLKRRGCRRRLHSSQDEQAHLSKMSSSSAPYHKRNAGKQLSAMMAINFSTVRPRVLRFLS